MRHYQSMRVPPFTDRNLRGELRKVDQWLRMLGTQMGRTVSLSQGTPSGSIGANLGDYLYLPGRPNGQISYGRVRFQAKPLPAGLVSVPDTSQTGFGLMATLARDGLTSLNLWLQSTNANNNPTPSREWAFPAFNEVEGDVAGLHFFVDEANYQRISFKTMLGTRWVSGTSTGEGWLDSTESKYINVTLENLPTNRNSSTHAQTATRAVIQVAPMDVLTGLVPASSTRDFTHTMGIVRTPLTASAPSATPFEKGGPIFGGDTGKELYGVGSAAKGAWAGPTQGDILTYNPDTTFTGDVASAATTIINTSVSTTTMRVGMRVRDTRVTTAYFERFVTQILTSNQIDTDVAFSENTAGITFVCFGPVWTPTSSISGIQHSLLSGLVWPADDHTQYVNIFGRTGGQFLATHGSGPVHPNSDQTDFVVHGTVGADPNNTNFTLSATGRRAFHASVAPTGALQGACLNAAYDFANQTTGGLSTAVQMSMVGNYSGSTSASVRGFFFLCQAAAGSGTMAELTGAQYTVTPGNPGAGTINALYASRYLVNAPTAAMTTNVWGIENLIGPKGMTGTLIHMQCTASTSSTATGAVSDYWGILFGSTAGGTPFDSNKVVNWTAIQIPDAPATPTGTIRGLKVGNIKSHHVGGFRFGDTTTPTHSIEIAAGTTAIAPLMLTSGTSLTTPVAGAIEFTTDDFFATITTGPARKAFVLDDGTRLTSGRVPFATTNGRLIDDADMTFATDTLTITKIAATTFTGNPTMNDGVNIPVGSTNGTKIATATTQKLGFWNTAPVVQPTTGITGATTTHVGGASIQDNDTFDGYTLAQVVAALRQIGVLA